MREREDGMILGGQDRGCIQRGSEDVFKKENEDWERIERERCIDGIFFFFFFFVVVMPAVVVRQRKPYRRKDGTTLYFEGTATDY